MFRTMSAMMFLIALLVNVDLIKEIDAYGDVQYRISFFGQNAFAQDTEPDYGNDFYGQCVFCYNQDEPGNSMVLINCWFQPFSSCTQVSCVPGFCGD